MDNLIQELEEQLAQVKEDTQKFQNGNKSAATRARVGAMNMIKTLKQLRVDIQVNR